MPYFHTPALKQPSFSQRLGAGIGEALPHAETYARDLQQVNIANKLGIDPEIMRSLDPENRQQIIGEALRRNIQTQQASKTAGVNLKLGQSGTTQTEEPQRDRRASSEDLMPTERKPLPGFMEERGRPASRGGGMIPQRATTGQKMPILDPDQVVDEGRRIQQESNDSGNPMTQYEGWALANQQNEARKAHAGGVESEQETARIAQRDYGSIGEEKLLHVYPEATDEQKAIFQRKAITAAEKPGATEASINKEMALEAKKFKNTIANVRASIGPARITSTQKILGTGREADAVKVSFRNKLKPLLDEGLYDTARNLLSELGYQPEERETILTDIGEGTKKALGEMPQMTRSKTAGKYKYTRGFPDPDTLNPLNDSQKSILRNNISEVFRRDPSTNLILLRKQYEDKNVDWREFSSAINEMIYSDQIKLNDDQFQMLDLIDMPPLNELEKILHGAKLIGR
jgi:hypothetical protein